MSSLPIDPRLARTLAPWEFFGGCQCLACAAIRDLREAAGRARRLLQGYAPGPIGRPAPARSLPGRGLAIDDRVFAPPPMNRHQRRTIEALRR